MPVIFWTKELISLYWPMKESFKPSFGRLLHKQENNMGESSEVFLSEILLSEAWRELSFQQWMKGGVKGEVQDRQSHLCNNERLTQGRKTVEEIVLSYCFFPWKTPSVLVGVVNEEGKDCIYKRVPQYKDCSGQFEKSILQKYLPYLQMRLPDSWERYQEAWLI